MQRLFAICAWQMPFVIVISYKLAIKDGTNILQKYYTEGLNNNKSPALYIYKCFRDFFIIL